MSDTGQDSDHGGPLPIGILMRTRRRKLGMTLQEVAEAADISTGYQSLIERDKATPTMTTLARIAEALGVDIDYFLDRPQPTQCVTRADDRPAFTIGASRITYERLGADFPGSELASFIMTIPPGHRSESVFHAGEESIYLLSGRLVLTLEGQDMPLATGDSAHYDSSHRHGWTNPHDVAARVLWTGTIDLFSK